MLKLVTGIKPVNLKRGFTLIEILVIILIVGITLRMAFLAYGDFGVKRHVMQMAEQLTHELDTLKLQAEIEATPFVIQFTTDHYRVIKLKQPQKTLKIVYFPHDLIIALHSNNTQQITIHPDGNFSNFMCILGTHNQPQMVRIIKTLNNTLQISNEGPK